MDNVYVMKDYELEKHYVGEAITLTTVMAVVAVAVVAVIIYRLFLSKEGNVTIPGGWKFTWE